MSTPSQAPSPARAQLPKASQQPWHAAIRLSYYKSGNRTLVSHEHKGPLRVQRPFFPEGSVNHTYLLHPPGGYVGTDRLRINASVDQNAHALMTTPGASKAYRSISGSATLTTELAVEGNLEWLPQESILFDGSDLNASTTLRIGAKGRVITWDIQCLGRPASNQTYDRGRSTVALVVENSEKVLLIDRLRLSGGGAALQAPWGLRRHTVAGLMIAYPADEQLCSQANAILEPYSDVHATLLDNLLVIRGLAHQAKTVRAAFTQAWCAIRPGVFGRQACIPRIWNT